MSPTPQPALTMLGSGSAFPKTSYNTCFVLDDGGRRILVDAGGGNGILRQMSAASVDVADIRDMIITHAHTDHILGAVWVVRAVLAAYDSRRYDTPFNVYANADTMTAFDTICRLTLLPAHYERMRLVTRYNTVADGEVRHIGPLAFRFIDVGSENVAQTGFDVTLSNGHRLVFLGDEALTERNAALCAGADTVMCGAFCRKADAETFHPYEKHHRTVADVAATARTLGVPHLVLIHCEDTTLPRRQDLYRAEAATVYRGLIDVPTDLTRIEFTSP